MQTLARARSQITPTVHHLLSSGASAAPSCGFRTLSHAHAAFNPLPNPRAAEPSTATPTSFPSFSPLNGHRGQLQPSTHSLARATHVALKNDEETDKIEAKDQLEMITKRQAFVGKVYGILASQLAATAAVSAVMVFNPSIPESILSSPGLVIGLFCCKSLLKVYPLNFITLGAFTLMQSILVGSCCALTDGRVVLEALATTTVALTTLTAYTFSAAQRGKDFSILGPILIPTLVASVVIGLIDIFVYPVPGIDSIAINALGALLFSGLLVFRTDHIIKRYPCDEYISAAAGLYLDNLNLFLRLMRILSKLRNRSGFILLLKRDKALNFTSPIAAYCSETVTLYGHCSQKSHHNAIPCYQYPNPPPPSLLLRRLRRTNLSFRTLCHAHTAFTPALSNSHAKHSTLKLKVNGHRRLQPSESNHSLALARSFCFFQQYSSTERKGGKPQQGTVSHATAIGETQVETEEGKDDQLQITKRRQAFIGKVYAIVATQLAATAAVSSVIVFNPSIAQFVANPGLLIALFFASLFTLWKLDVYKKEYPLNFIALGAFTLMQSLLVGSCCAFTDGKVVLEALAATTVAVTSLTGYTFWTAKRGKDFGFLEPILFPPHGHNWIDSLPGIHSIAYSAFGALLFSGYLVLSTDDLIKRNKYDEYIPAATGIYLDIINLFLRIMRILSKLKKK
ncbi:Bax inhibitor 1-related protein [Corchorus capsularis]|uniref:Bax inhibitor 1-related protein n=1 Tax=Corchorus capsularis TaxID=210143 RepID=A0A1R3G6T9_COCAP|nr:Bax inhibitor 1-related protein [Corchorus capsularis]